MMKHLWDRFKRFCKKYESVVSVLFTVLPTIGKLLSKTIITRVLASTLGLSAMGMVALINQEDFKTTAYRDQVGIPTIGPGLTKGVKMGDTITVRQGINRFAKELQDDYEAGLHKYAGDIPMFQSEYDVYLRVTYNIGVQAFSTSTMLRKLKQGDYAGACEAIKLFNKVTVDGKKVLSRGLASLREEQYKECMKDPNQ